MRITEAEVQKLGMGRLVTTDAEVSLEDGQLPGVTGLSECERVARRPVAESRDQDCGSVARAPAESFRHESSRVRVWEQKEGAGRMSPAWDICDVGR